MAPKKAAETVNRGDVLVDIQAQLARVAEHAEKGKKAAGLLPVARHTRHAFAATPCRALRSAEARRRD